MNDRQIEPESQAGLAARSAAIAVLTQILIDRTLLDDAFAASVREGRLRDAQSRDRAFTRALVATTLRRLGQIDDVLGHFVERPIPRRAGPTRQILRLSTAEILFLKGKPHAAVNSAVTLANQDSQAHHYKSLVNAVLRRVAEAGAAIVENQDAARLNTPDWLWARWNETYGPATARAIAETHLSEPPLDLTVKDPDTADRWVDMLNATILPTGTLRRTLGGQVDTLAGFTEGAWWVQDAAAALPVRLLGNVRGQTVLDLCAAPGGKTAQLAAAGAHVIAVDQSQARLGLVRQNFERLGLKAELVAGDAGTWRVQTPVSHLLLDAPCTATGTIRRHPDLPHLKKPEDVSALAQEQRRLLDNARNLLAPGGTLVFCTCSLEPEEGPELIASFLADHNDFARLPLEPKEVGGFAEFVTEEGDLRTLPCHWPDLGGLDGFYAARLKRR